MLSQIFEISFLRVKLGAILVTNRHPDSHALANNQIDHFIELLSLGENAVVALLIRQSHIHEGISTDATKIVKRFGCHPIAVIRAEAYIRKRNLRLCELMDNCNRWRNMIWNLHQLSQYRKKLDNIACVYDLGTLVSTNPIIGLGKCS